MLQVWNPSDKHAEIALSGGNLTVTGTTTYFRSVRATVSVSSGKWYWEYNLWGTQLHCVGVGTSSADLDHHIGLDNYGYGYQRNGRRYHGSSSWEYGPVLTDNPIVGVAFDLDAGKIWFSKNGVWIGDPVAGTGEAFSGISGSFFPMYSTRSLSHATANFGASAYSYSIPSGFSSFPQYGAFVDLPIPEIAGYGKYTGDVTWIPLKIDWLFAYGHDGIILPLLETNITGSKFTAVGTVELPALRAEALGATGGAGAVEFPSLSAEGKSGALLSLDLPVFTISGLSGAIGGVGIIEFPLLNTESRSGAPLLLDFPVLTAEGLGGIGTVVVLDLPALEVNILSGLHGEVDLPIVICEAEGTVGEAGSASLFLPMLSIEAEGVVRIIGRAEIDLAALEFAGTGLTGKIGGVKSNLPILSIEAEGTVQIIGRAEVDLATLRFAGVGLTGEIGEVKFSLPMLEVSADGALFPSGDIDVDLALSVLGSGIGSIYRFWDYAMRYNR